MSRKGRGEWHMATVGDKAKDRVWSDYTSTVHGQILAWENIDKFGK